MIESEKSYLIPVCLDHDEKKILVLASKKWECPICKSQEN